MATVYLLRYGKLTVLSYTKKGAYKTAICRCDCGNIKEIYLSNLKGKRTKSCGCLEEKNRKKFNDISGKRYHLGSYKKLDDAKKARKQAEKELFLPIIEKSHIAKK